MIVLDRGAHLGIYHIGTLEEISIETLARLVAEHFGRPIKIVPGPPAAGGTNRRCPDITKMMKLGLSAEFHLARSAAATSSAWYDERVCRERHGAGHVIDMNESSRELARAAGTGGSVVVDRCQVCGSATLESVLFLGYLPPVNQMRPVGTAASRAAGVSSRAASLHDLPAGAAGPDRRSGDSLSRRVSVHERHDADPARELRRAPARSRPASLGLARIRARRRRRIERRHAARELQGGGSSASAASSRR